VIIAKRSVQNIFYANFYRENFVLKFIKQSVFKICDTL